MIRGIQLRGPAAFRVFPLLALGVALSSAAALGGCAGGEEDHCPRGRARCGGDCVELREDPMHCGGCGIACDAGEVCSEGACVPACPAGMAPCDGQCVHLDRDWDHCGACGNPCPAGEMCASGECVAACPQGMEACERSCVDLRADRENCGACGEACAPGMLCTGGELREAALEVFANTIAPPTGLRWGLLRYPDQHAALRRLRASVCARRGLRGRELRSFLPGGLRNLRGRLRGSAAGSLPLWGLWNRLLGRGDLPKRSLYPVLPRGLGALRRLLRGFLPRRHPLRGMRADLRTR